MVIATIFTEVIFVLTSHVSNTSISFYWVLIPSIILWLQYITMIVWFKLGIDFLVWLWGDCCYIQNVNWTPSHIFILSFLLWNVAKRTKLNTTFRHLTSLHLSWVLLFSIYDPLKIAYEYGVHALFTPHAR